MNQFFRKSIIAGAAVAALAVSYAAPAQAWWRGGVVVAPFPFFAPPPPVVYPPYYYAPPAYYPPPAAYTPAPSYSQGGRACYAGGYVCPLYQPVPPGGACSCPTNGGGRIGGAAG